METVLEHLDDFAQDGAAAEFVRQMVENVLGGGARVAQALDLRRNFDQAVWSVADEEVHEKTAELFFNREIRAPTALLGVGREGFVVLVSFES